MKSTFYYLFILLLFPAKYLCAQTSFSIDVDKPLHAVSPMLYGLMTEEINHSYDGGLYGELIKNRIFKDSLSKTADWTLIQQEAGKGSISLDFSMPLNEVLDVSLKLEVASSGEPVGAANTGYWGIPVKPKTTYNCSFYAKTSNSNAVPLTVAIQSNDGKTVYAQSEVTGIMGDWKQYTTTLTTSNDVKITDQARFVITTKESGTYWFTLVSLFAPTFNNRPNGNRPDIMEMLGELKPKFLRFPGGNDLEGFKFSTRLKWKKTLGSLTGRPGHLSYWKYRATDGMGLLEFLQWCEDLKMEPLLGVFAGYVINDDYLVDEEELRPFVQDALDQIEYITGDVSTKWGVVRAAEGHPEPFTLNYLEIGNEDTLDTTYESRFKQFYNAIRAKYPKLQLISTTGTEVLSKDTPPDLVDEHFYFSATVAQKKATHYDNYDRNGPKIFIGEWATREGALTNNFNAALGDAAFMTGIERNSDIIKMASYAPLLTNVNEGAYQWTPNLIGYNATSVYGSPSYYAQKMFSNYLGNQVLKTDAVNIPSQLEKLNKQDSIKGVKAEKIPTLFYVVTKNSTTGTVYLKVVNTSNTAQNVLIDLKGVSKVASNGLCTLLKANGPKETNSITEPKNIVPVTTKIKGIKKKFNYAFPAYSISVLQLETSK